MTRYEQEQDNRKVCPLITTGDLSHLLNCLEERCALWNESRQKCAMAIIPPRNK